MRLLSLLFGAWISLCLHATVAQKTTVSTDSLAVLLETSRDFYHEYDYRNAITTSALLIDEASKADDKYYMFRGYNELGQIYSYALGDSIKGRSNYENALEQALASNTDSLITWAYRSLGNSYAEGGHSSKAIEYYEKSIAINEKNKEDDVKNLVEYINIGWTYLDQKEYEIGYSYLLKAKQLAGLKKQTEQLHLNLQILFGRYYLAKGNTNIAIRELREVADVSQAKDYVFQAKESNKYLSQAYELKGNYALANESLKKENAYEDRILDRAKVSQLEEASAKFELQQYQRDLESARKEQAYADELVKKSKLLTKILIISSITFLIAFIALFALFKSRKKYIARMHIKNSELTEAKEEAERLSKLKSQFFSTVSHELRTPLYGVIGLSSILLEDHKLTSHRDDLKSLKFSADYLLALINDVLTINKMDANGIKLEHTPFKLSVLMNNIIKSFAFSLEQNNNSIHLFIDDAIPNRLIGDSVRLSQILMNVVGNAVKFNENGNIWVSVELLANNKDGTYNTKFSVMDDGIGIPEDKQKAIFEEFSQVENKNYDYQGTGLGLPIVKKLLALHKSEITLKSDSGKGATFSFILPLEEDVTSSLESDEVKLSIPLNDRPIFEDIHILVVDDNKINQKITQKILKTRHFQCSLANGGAEAIQLVREHNYDLILMDIHMPNVDGIEATTEIRKFNQSIPIVALTAVEVDEIRNAAAACGMNDIILKPYDVSQFLNTILRNLKGVLYAKAQ